MTTGYGAHPDKRGDELVQIVGRAGIDDARAIEVDVAFACERVHLHSTLPRHSSDKAA